MTISRAGTLSEGRAKARQYRQNRMNDQQTKFPPLPDDGLGLPDLQEWIAFYGGYHKIPPEAWAEWDRLNEAYRERRQR